LGANLQAFNMIYTLVGTDARLREKALIEIAKLGNPTAHIYAEHISALPALIEAGSLFGDRVIAHVIQTLEKAESRDFVYDLLPLMQESENIFIIDEPLLTLIAQRSWRSFQRSYMTRARKRKGIISIWTDECLCATGQKGGMA
jgi:hypothetical protein